MVLGAWAQPPPNPPLGPCAARLARNPGPLAPPAKPARLVGGGGEAAALVQEVQDAHLPLNQVEHVLEGGRVGGLEEGGEG